MQMLHQMTVAENWLSLKEKTTCPYSTLTVTCNSEYCIQAWRQYLRKDIDLIDEIQRRAAKKNKSQEVEKSLATNSFYLTTLKTRLRGD